MKEIAENKRIKAEKQEIEIIKKLQNTTKLQQNITDEFEKMNIDSVMRGDYENFNNKIKFIGEYLNGKRYNGKGYNSKGDLLYELKNGNGYVIEYYDINKLKYLLHSLDDINEKGKDHILFEGEYLNGEKNGKGIEYYFNGNKIYEGEYKNGRRWNGI